MYYLRIKPAVNAIQFTVDKLALKKTVKAEKPLEDITNGVGVRSLQEQMISCSLDDPEGCLMCSS